MDFFLFHKREVIFNLEKGSPTLTVIVPAERKIIPMGTFRSICKQANLQPTDFE